MLVASGDSGAYGQSSPYSDPSESAYVTSVGGTELKTNGVAGAWASEVAWSLSGGGVSYNGVAIPAYQQQANLPGNGNGASSSLRNIPDVSAVADYFYYCAQGSCGTGLEGTSLSTPIWASLIAMLNQQAEKNGTQALGFLNPNLYPIYSTTGYASAFHDITQNDSTDNYAATATQGYDLATGLGSPIIADAPPAPTLTHYGSCIVRAGGSTCYPQTITIRDNSSSAQIYYTIDNSVPTSASTPYMGSFQVNPGTMVKAIAAFGLSTSPVSTITASGSSF